jgi:hypothetical protein
MKVKTIDDLFNYPGSSVELSNESKEHRFELIKGIYTTEFSSHYLGLETKHPRTQGQRDLDMFEAKYLSANAEVSNYSIAEQFDISPQRVQVVMTDVQRRFNTFFNKYLEQFKPYEFTALPFQAAGLTCHYDFAQLVGLKEVTYDKDGLFEPGAFFESITQDKLNEWGVTNIAAEDIKPYIHGKKNLYDIQPDIHNYNQPEIDDFKIILSKFEESRNQEG